MHCGYGGKPCGCQSSNVSTAEDINGAADKPAEITSAMTRSGQASAASATSAPKAPERNGFTVVERGGTVIG